MSALKTTITLRRNGAFKCQTVGESHCGISPAIDIQYHVEIRCTDSLDERGFIIAQEELSAYFEATKSTKLSCEELARKCAKDIWRTVLANGVEVFAVSVRLSPPSYAGSAEAVVSVE